MVTANTHRPIVTVQRPARIGVFLVLVKAISQSVAAAPGTFNKPDPTLAQFNTDIAALDAAQTTTKTRAPGAVAIRDQKRATVVLDLRRLVGYVQGIVDLDPSNATAIVAAAGMSLRKVPSRTKAPLAVKPHAISGTVSVAAKAVGKTTSNEWQFSVDGGKTWTAAPSTTKSRTTIPNLTPGVLTLFRHRANTKAGPANWSQTVSLMVV